MQYAQVMYDIHSTEKTYANNLDKIKFSNDRSVTDGQIWGYDFFYVFGCDRLTASPHVRVFVYERLVQYVWPINYDDIMLRSCAS